MRFWWRFLEFLGTPRGNKTAFSLEGCSKSKVDLFAPKRPRGWFWEPFWHPKGSQNHEKTESTVNEQMEAKKVNHMDTKSGHADHWPEDPGPRGSAWGGRGGTAKQNTTCYLTRPWAVGPANLIVRVILVWCLQIFVSMCEFLSMVGCVCQYVCVVVSIWLQLEVFVRVRICWSLIAFVSICKYLLDFVVFASTC